ncbi:MAG: class I SAM-dependent methyltransferase [Myxococcaceae bacterium]
MSDRQTRDEYNQRGAREGVSHLKDYAGWDYLSPQDWTSLARRTADFVGIKDGDACFEAGCGSGAFLAELAAYRRISLAGVDFAENLVAIARAKLVGAFTNADITAMPHIPSARYDVVLSHGVFLYLGTVDRARSAALELFRVARPGARVYVGIVNDPDRQAPTEHPPSGTFFLNRSFWRAFAQEQGATLSVVDQDSIFSKDAGYDCYSRLRYSVLLTTPGSSHRP